MKRFIKFILPPFIIYLIKKIYPADNLFEGNNTLFKKSIIKSKNYGEYGCGYSTNWVFKNIKNIANIYSVDTSLFWINKVKKNINDSKVQIKHINLGELSEWGRPNSYEFRSRFQDYTDWIWKQEVYPDFVLIDGRFRVCCFLTSLLYAKEGTQIIIDDYKNRKHYHIVEEFLKPYEMDKRQALFKVPSKEQLNIKKINIYIERFRYVFD